jgi:putative flippase GtrA
MNMGRRTCGGAVRRWATFNIVGALGVAVQLMVLTALVRFAHVHYLAATVLAVEAALLHNFAWHQRWTWRDRRSDVSRNWLARLRRFHLINGSVSLAGNAVIVSVLTGQLGLDPILSNIIAVLTCSMLNFFGSDRIVFSEAALGACSPCSDTLLAWPEARRQPPAHGRRWESTARSRRTGWTLPRASLTALITMLMVYPSAVSATEMFAELKQATLAAWHVYERRVDERYARLDERGTFFAQDDFSAPGNWRPVAIGGGVPMLRVERPAPGAAEVPVPEGRIHHWSGAVFVRGVALDGVLRYLQEHAGRESDAYEDVLASKLLAREGDRVRVYMKLRRTSVITVTYNTEHAVEYRRIGSTRASSRSVATKIVELEEAGTAREHEKPPAADRGFLWRLNAYWRYEQTADGVIIECESVSLSRGVPTLLRPFITGTVERIARESLERTLTSLRAALEKGAGVT